MSTFTTTRIDRHGMTLPGSPVRKYETKTPADAARNAAAAHMTASELAVVDVEQHDDVWTFIPETGSSVYIRVTAEPVETGECADCAALGWVELCDNCGGRAESFAPVIEAEIERPAITAAEARARVLLTAKNTYAEGDTVRCTLPEFAGTRWSEPMTVERIVPRNPVGKPVLARTADDALGAFSPADLELVR